MGDEEAIKVTIDWERQTSEQVNVTYSGAASGTVAFSPDTPRVEKKDADGKVIEPTAKETALQDAQAQLAADLDPVVDALRGVEMAAPSYKGKPTGDPPKLYRVIITEGTAKALKDGAVVDAPTYDVEALWGEPGNPTRHKLGGGGDLADLIDLAVASARELVEAHLA